MSTFAEVNQRFKDLMTRARIDMSERAVTMCLMSVKGYAIELAPQATSTLVNSAYQKTEITVNGVSGEVGFGADYAKYVHDAPGTLLGTSTPRSPARLGYVWDPGAEPQFLTSGVQEMVQNDMAAILSEAYTI